MKIGGTEKLVQKRWKFERRQLALRLQVEAGDWRPDAYETDYKVEGKRTKTILVRYFI